MNKLNFTDNTLVELYRITLLLCKRKRISKSIRLHFINTLLNDKLFIKRTKASIKSVYVSVYGTSKGFNTKYPKVKDGYVMGYADSFLNTLHKGLNNEKAV